MTSKPDSTAGSKLARKAENSSGIKADNLPDDGSGLV